MNSEMAFVLLLLMTFWVLVALVAYLSLRRNQKAAEMAIVDSMDRLRTTIQHLREDAERRSGHANVEVVKMLRQKDWR
jgi:hypothetical protein